MRTTVVALLLQAMRAGLQGTMRIKGLLEMMFEVLSDWIDAFIEDIEEVEGSETGNTTPKGSVSPRDSRGETPGPLLQHQLSSLITYYWFLPLCCQSYGHMVSAAQTALPHSTPALPCPALSCPALCPLLNPALASVRSTAMFH